MSTERYINFVTKTPTGTGYGDCCKALVEAVLACDTCFTIAQVDTDTSATYKVWLRLFDSNIYLNIYNSSNTLYFGYYYGLSGTKIGSSQIQQYFTTGVRYGAIISRIGDFFITLCLQSDYSYCSSQTVIFRFAKGVSEYNGETYWFCTSEGRDLPVGSYSGCYPSLSSSPYAVKPSTGALYPYNFSSLNEKTNVTSPTGAVGVLNPVHYYAYNNVSDWLGHIKWGGQYDLYHLYSPSGIYAVDPNGNYTIDGTTYKGVFTEMIIPVPCD